ncbi:MAG: hypothetical protein WC878_07370 [Candidatus Paceibacterota bacterium]|jgi:hypothetical protein
MLYSDLFHRITVGFENKKTGEVLTDFFEIYSNRDRADKRDDKILLKDVPSEINKRINAFLREHPDYRFVNISNSVKG